MLASRFVFSEKNIQNQKSDTIIVTTCMSPTNN